MSTATKNVEKSDVEKRRIAYNLAETRLKDLHRDEFIGLVKEEASKLGVTYEPRKTAEEKAQDKIKALLDEFPGLADKFNA